MDKLLTVKETVEMVAAEVFRNGEVHEVQTLNTQVGMMVGGRLSINRPASVWVTVTDGLVGVRVGVPGNGGMGYTFRMFEDELTEARVRRYMEHYADLLTPLLDR